MQESSLKTNFLGRDGFRWWIGQIPQESAHGGQINGAGWGNRFKVRIMGYHPYDLTELPDNDLPWAQCLLPTTSGTGAGNNATSVKVSPGDVVFGFFLDTDNAQTPVIMGCFGRTSQVLTSNKPGPFQPFTGYTDKVKKPNGTLKPDQSSEQNAQSQKSPRHVSPEQAKNIGDDEISYFSGIGDKIQLANTVNNTLVGKISTEVGNLLNKIKVPAIFTNIANEINRVTDKIQAIANGLVGNMVNGLFTNLIPILNKGLDLLFDKVKAVSGYNAAVKALTNLISPIKILQDLIPCIGGSIVNSLGSVIKNILTSVVDNVQNFVSCAANQFTGALVNDIIGKISSGLSSAIGGIQKILQFFPSFSIEGILRGSIDAIKGIVGMFDCNQSKGKSNGIVDQWVIGSGPANAPGPNFAAILENANIAGAISAASSLLDGVQGAVGAVTDVVGGVQNVVGGVAGAFSAINNLPGQIGNCYTGPPAYCGSPTCTIFGGGGTGATAIPLMGAIAGSTGSIIGAKLTNAGSGYRFPPFVEIVDECNQGYGAIARATINDAGEVTSIYIVSEGENYPVGDLYDNSSTTTANTVINNSTETQTQSLVARNYIVKNVLIQNPGQNYSQTDTATDQFGNDYSIEVFEGYINKIQPINISGNDITTNTNTNTVVVNDLPIITIESETGSGAILRPILDIEPAEFQGEVKQVIDCVT
jgi:hypothetical protein